MIRNSSRAEHLTVNQKMLVRIQLSEPFLGEWRSLGVLAWFGIRRPWVQIPPSLPFFTAKQSDGWRRNRSWKATRLIALAGSIPVFAAKFWWRSWIIISIIRFSDNISFDTDQKLTIKKEYDGLYVVGEGMLIPIDSIEEGQKIIEDYYRKN